MNREQAARLAFDMLAKREITGPTRQIMLLVADMADLFVLLPSNVRPLRPSVPTSPLPPSGGDAA